MFKKLYPDVERDSAYIIDYEKLYGNGIRGLIFDIDNTLVCHGAPANDAAVKLFKRLHEIGFKTLVLSNNKEPRVKPFADMTECLYIFKANKPSKSGYIKAMEMMGTDVKSTVFIGDQLLTDMWGASNAGMFKILVKPIDKKEEIQIVLKRILEKFILFTYHHSKACKKEGTLL